MFLLSSAFTGAQKQHLGGVGQLNGVGNHQQAHCRQRTGFGHAMLQRGVQIPAWHRGAEGVLGCQKSPRCVKKLWVALSLTEGQAPPSGRAWAWAWAEADCWHLSACGKGAYLLISR